MDDEEAVVRNGGGPIGGLYCDDVVDIDGDSDVAGGEDCADESSACWLGLVDTKAIDVEVNTELLVGEEGADVVTTEVRGGNGGRTTSLFVLFAPPVSSPADSSGPRKGFSGRVAETDGVAVAVTA